MKEAVQRLIRNIKVPACLLVYGGLSTGRGEEEEEEMREKPTTEKQQLRRKSLSAAAAAVCGLSEWEEEEEKHAQLSYERQEVVLAAVITLYVQWVHEVKYIRLRQVSDRLRSDGVTT